MSQNTANYMDGVPVKISEKYKPPPKILLPQSIIGRLAISEHAVLATNYDFNLEKLVLTKISDWKNVRQQERCYRRERIRQRQQERQKQIEEKQKQLLTAVSYPSAEDFSSDDETVNCTETIPKIHLSSMNCFDTILVPTVLPGPASNNSNDMICTSLNQNICGINTNFNKINYSDFENDTSSPFDNIELKTINDLDILAQVLKKSSLHSNETNSSKVATENSESHEFENENVNKNDNIQIIQQNQILNENIQNSNEFYTQSGIRLTDFQPNQINFSQYDSSYDRLHENYYNYIRQSTDPPEEASQTAMNDYYNVNASNIPSINYYYNSNSSAPSNENYAIDYEYINNCNAQLGNVNSQQKSKSVPDILKELNAELKDSEMRRTRNNSHSNTNSENDVDTVATLKNPKPPEEKFRKLSHSSQKLARNISSMGFPLDRVERVAEKYGKDDKKIVEHLILLGELLDLGFDESKISEALIKFDNNKEKALDFLI